MLGFRYTAVNHGPRKFWVPLPEEAVLDAVVRPLARALRSSPRCGKERLRVLDIGCGTGSLLVALRAELGDTEAELVGADASPIATKAGREAAREAGVALETVALTPDIVLERWGGALDAVVCMGASHCVGGFAAAPAALAALLKSDGGVVAFGDLCWQAEPRAELLEALGDGIPRRGAYAEAFRRAGLESRGGWRAASGAEWREYEDGNAARIRAYDGPDAAALLARSEGFAALDELGKREALGFEASVLETM